MIVEMRQLSPQIRSPGACFTSCVASQRAGASNLVVDMDAKACSRCKETKPLDQFYKHRLGKLGRRAQCIPCFLAYGKELREKYPERTSANFRRWYYKNREQEIKRVQKNRKDNPQKYKAQIAVTNALANGSLVRCPCEVCGATKVDAHHEDYSKPLSVTWLCREHHMDRHEPGRKRATS